VSISNLTDLFILPARLPKPGGLNDLRKRKSRPPIQLLEGSPVISNQNRRISVPAAGNFVGQRDSRSFLHCLNYLADRVTLPAAQIESPAWSLMQKILQCCEMC